MVPNKFFTTLVKDPTASMPPTSISLKAGFQIKPQPQDTRLAIWLRLSPMTRREWLHQTLPSRNSPSPKIRAANPILPSPIEAKSAKHSSNRTKKYDIQAIPTAYYKKSTARRYLSWYEWAMRTQQSWCFVSASFIGLNAHLIYIACEVRDMRNLQLKKIEQVNGRIGLTIADYSIKGVAKQAWATHSLEIF